jgi:hypothetical protein
VRVRKKEKSFHKNISRRRKRRQIDTLRKKEKMSKIDRRPGLMKRIK